MFCKPCVHGFCMAGVIHVRLCGALHCILLVIKEDRTDAGIHLFADGFQFVIAAVQMRGIKVSGLGDGTNLQLLQMGQCVEGAVISQLAQFQFVLCHPLQTLRPLHGLEPRNRVLDHDGILLLGWFMILAARFNEESWEKLVEYEKEHEEDPDADLFTKKSGRLLREIAKIDSSAPM